MAYGGCNVLAESPVNERVENAVLFIAVGSKLSYEPSAIEAL